MGITKAHSFPEEAIQLSSDCCHAILKACQNHRRTREPLPLKSTVGRQQHVGADGYRALPVTVTGSDPFLLGSSLLAAV